MSDKPSVLVAEQVSRMPSASVNRNWAVRR
jgi:hypothetical protein